MGTERKKKKRAPGMIGSEKQKETEVSLATIYLSGMLDECGEPQRYGSVHEVGANSW